MNKAPKQTLYEVYVCVYIYIEDHYFVFIFIAYISLLYLWYCSLMRWACYNFILLLKMNYLDLFSL